MRPTLRSALVIIVAFPRFLLAADPEIGAAGGFGFYHDETIANANGSAQAGFGPRFAVSGFAGGDLGRFFGVQGRYIFQDGDVELKSPAGQANLDGDTQSVLGEFLLYGQKPSHRLRFYLAAGFGVKLYQATQTITGPRPLSDIASLNTASQARPLISYGPGIQYSFAPHWRIRLDLRDYTTPFPQRVITPAPGARRPGWLHDLVPMLGISRVFR